MTLPRSEARMNAWREPILKAQRRLLNLYASHYTWKERPITLANNHVVNVVIATRHKQDDQRHQQQQDDKDEDKGTGVSNRILVLMHGWGAGLGYYARALPYLVPSFEAVYLLDLPGMAASSRHAFPRRDRDASLTYFLSDLNAAFDTLQRTDSLFASGARTLGAHSLGAYIATEWVLQAANNFKNLVLISPVGVPPRPENTNGPQSIRWRLVKLLWKAGVTPQAALRHMPQGVGRRYCTRYIETRFATPDAHEQQTHIDGMEEIDAMTEYCYRVSVAPGASEYAMNSLLTPGAWAVVPLRDRLPLVTVPSAFVYGERDWMDWKAGEAASQSMRVATQVVRVADADHNVFVDNAKGFANALVKAVVAFENGVSLRGGSILDK